ncbi:MAG: PIN domain-containing protein [Candidatus Scalindua sp.]
MSDNYFIDTNIFIYTFSETEKRKKKLAKELISKSLSSENAVISTQVIQEFINVSTQKFKKPLDINDCKKYINNVMEPLCSVYPEIELFNLGLDIKAETQYGFYDSLIIAASIKGNCNTLYSEDMQHNDRVRSTRIINPLL